MSQAPTVAIVSGFWGQNIGNAFFNIGGKWLLDQVFGHQNVAFIQDQPAYQTLNRKSKGNPSNDFGLLRHLDVEYVVLQGPMLTKTFSLIWGDTFREYRRRGVRTILLGAALFKFSREEIEAARTFLKEFPPFIIVTRDRDSYEAIKDCASFTYSGIDSAFFVPLAYRPVPLVNADYVTLTFDRFPEPSIEVQESTARTVLKSDVTFDSIGYIWALKTPKLQQRISAMGKWQAYLGWLIDRRNLPHKIGKYEVIRPEHRYHPYVGWKIYKYPNAVASDEPFTFFSLYAATRLTLSDRVHACVVTLAYGNPAMLFTSTPRARLFDRLGLGEIRTKPVILDPSLLERERNNEIDFLATALGKKRLSTEAAI